MLLVNGNAFFETLFRLQQHNSSQSKLLATVSPNVHPEQKGTLVVHSDL